MRKACATTLLAACFALAQEPAPVTFGTTVVVSGGLRGTIYFLKPGTAKLPNFASLKKAGVIYTSSLNVPRQSFTRGFPGVTNRFEWFAIDYTGDFWIETPGDYCFSLLSDDGAKLWIDDHLVIDNDGAHPPRELTADIELARGAHALRVAYFQGRRFEVALVLKIAPPGEDYKIFRTGDFKPSAQELADTETPHGRVLIDNDFVHVVAAVLAPRETSRDDVFNRVVVLRSGKVFWNAAQDNYQNPEHKPLPAIFIALKKPAPVNPPPRARDLDPVLIDQKHNKLIFENDQVRVFKSWREPGGVEKIHEHTGAGRVGIFLTPADAIVRANGAETKLTAAAGDVTWSGPVKHATENTGTKKLEMIIVEVK